MALRVGVVGLGSVGETLGKRLTAANVPVVYGVRDPSKYANRKDLKIAPVQDAIKGSDVVILAVPGSADDAAIKAVAASLEPAIKGKVLIDATNPLTPYPGLEYRWGAVTSGGEVLAAALPDTIVYKAFNTLGDNLMAHPDGSTLTNEQLTLLFAGGPAKKDEVEKVITAVGFKPSYVGPIRYARNLEAIAELWIHTAMFTEKWGRNFHFQVLKK